MTAIAPERPDQRPQVLAINRAAFEGEIEVQLIEAVIVLGHRDFYPRFGFSPDLAERLQSPFQGDAHFMGLELKPGALAGKAGTCRYPSAFGL